MSHACVPSAWLKAPVRRSEGKGIPGDVVVPKGQDVWPNRAACAVSRFGAHPSRRLAPWVIASVRGLGSGEVGAVDCIMGNSRRWLRVRYITAYQLRARTGELAVSDEVELHTAMAYLADLDVEVEERGTTPDARANAAAREDMLYQLQHARQIVDALECGACSIFSVPCQRGRDALINLKNARAWCHAVENRIALVCCDRSITAAA